MLLSRRLESSFTGSLPSPVPTEQTTVSTVHLGPSQPFRSPRRQRTQTDNLELTDAEDGRPKSFPYKSRVNRRSKEPKPKNYKSE